MKHFLYTLIVLCFLSLCLEAQQVQTVSVHSAAMSKDINNLVILPEDYDAQQEKKYPVVYLLHGHGMDYKGWLKVQPRLPQLATQYGFIIVCPDGSTSWYWDSPIDPSIRYETYVAKELTDYVNNHYKVINDKRARAISGLSMGGHGALWLAIRHQDTFGACGSTSGGVDIRPFPKNWNMSKALGEYADNPQRWDEHTVINQITHIRPGLALIIDCGTEDFFYEVNESLHKALLEKGIKHTYITRPGAHRQPYWRNSILYHFLFYSEHFRQFADLMKTQEK